MSTAQGASDADDRAQNASVIDDPWLDLPGCAKRAVCNERTIRRMIRAGLLRKAYVGVGRKHIRVRQSWLDTAMEAAATPVEVK